AFESKKLGSISLLLINKSNSTIKSFPGIVYFDMTDQNITDKINMILFESINSKSLFFSTNLKF
ncbi:MAG: hypothetical protein C0412_10825, partial [Flavobacterium sp.]|nr:hypothetical protein [Flavobacterium sp.]